ncbi:MAG: hypothetical protein Q7J20_05220 [Candidatus Nitrotoga sp.]|nr:hypothetical protein [Candidatus Nitrotoga sp.]MDO9447287.1 hypothetical protein [Candidatus Nitrotoga sp.]MDP3496159.1 hypothetical protein [Candidatus Nitrotoga sp.]
MEIPINPKLATKLLKQVVPQYDEFISALQADPEILSRIMLFAQKSGLSGYPQLYLDKQNIVKLVLATLMPVAQINALGESVKSLSQEDQVTFANQAVENFVQSPERLDAILDPLIPGNPDDVEPSQLSDQEKIALTAFLMCTHEMISFLVHGRKITDLIQSAINGDDEAFCLAVQTDKLVLSLPFFKDRLSKALKLESDKEAKFLYNLFYRMQNPVLRGQIKQPKVWIALLLLDSMALLDGSLTRAELLAMLDEAGIEGVGSEDNISRMLRRFRSYQDAM